MGRHAGKRDPGGLVGGGKYGKTETQSGGGRGVRGTSEGLVTLVGDYGYGEGITEMKKGSERA